MVLKPVFLSFVVLFEFSKFSHAFGIDIGCGNIPSRKGNLSMVSKAWKNGVKVRTEDNPAFFFCFANNKHATVSLQYYTHKWNNIMTPSKKFPAGSVLHLGSWFFLRRRRGMHHSGFFRCVVKAHGDEICLKLGYLLFATKNEPGLTIWPHLNPLKVKEGKRLLIDCIMEGYRSWLQWYKRTKGTDKELDSSLVTTRHSDPNDGDYQTKSVRFTKVTKNHSGTYVCKKHGSLPGEKAFEKSVNLIVLDKSSKEIGWRTKDDN